MSTSNSIVDIAKVTIQNNSTVTYGYLTQIFGNLLENDVTIYSNMNFLPRFWENRRAISKDLAGYMKGDTIIQNVLTDKQFIEQYADIVYSYAKKSGSRYFADISGTTYSQLTNDDKSRLSGTYCTIANGQSNENGNFSMQPLLLYGDRSKPVKIYVSKYDNNYVNIYDTDYWQCMQIEDDDDIKRLVDQIFNEMVQDHIENYHANLPAKYSDAKSILTAQYLSTDAQNIDTSNIEKFTSSKEYVLNSLDCFKSIAQSTLSTLVWKSGLSDIFGNSTTQTQSYELTGYASDTDAVSHYIANTGTSKRYGFSISCS